VLFLGASDKAWGALPLPWRYVATCDLLVSIESLTPFVTTATGTASIPVPIPNNKALVGVVAFEQVLVMDSSNAFGLIASNGGRLRIGEF
jgi:hypothetical protein